jgi:GTPase Era involved in 16S rRNA processing
MNKVYPTLVVGTMSSGKSTLINALVGAELLPSMTTACTARAAAILDNDMKQRFAVHAVDKDGKYSYIEEDAPKAVMDFNKSGNLAEMIAEGEIKGVHNSKKSLLLIDTPGINYSMDSSHEAATKRALDEYSGGLILYVINAGQFGVDDDSRFLSYVARKLEQNKKFKILFAVNKMDDVDPEKESPDEFIEKCKDYIENNGIENPVIVPVSAEIALLLKKVLGGYELTKKEKQIFSKGYKQFRRDGYSLQDYMRIPERGRLSETIDVNRTSYTRAQLYAALENTGLPYLEKQIDEMLVRSLKMRAPNIKAK